MGKCNHRLTDGKPCGIESNDILCWFHRYRPFMHGHQGQLRRYAELNTRDSLDLSDMVFEHIVFTPDILPTDKPLIFDGSEFNNCVFRHLDIRTSLRFRKCSLKNSYFDWVQFHGEVVDFSLATISGPDVVFRTCTFVADRAISFAHAVIDCRHTPFVRTYIKAPQVDFIGCSVDADRLNILASSLDGEIPEHGFLALDAPKTFFVGFKLTGHFEYGNHLDCLDYDPKILFSLVNFSQMKTATFIDANLERARFAYSKLDNVHFITPRWPVQDGRWIIYDELERFEGQREDHIKDTYIQLKRNFEDGRKFSEAGEWFYREMECRRRILDAGTEGNALVKWLTRNLFRLYKAVSDYGENLVKPFLLLIGLFLLWGVLYFYAGFGSGSETINYEFGFEYTDGAASDFITALAFSGGVMLLQFVKLAAEQPSPTPVLAVVQVLFTLILVPLFLLALRRKFRR